MITLAAAHAIATLNAGRGKKESATERRQRKSLNHSAHQAALYVSTAVALRSRSRTIMMRFLNPVIVIVQIELAVCDHVNLLPCDYLSMISYVVAHQS